MPSGSTHVGDSGRFHYFHGLITFHYIATCPLDSSLDGQSDCFHILTTGNNTAVNMNMWYLFWILDCISLHIYLEVGLMDHIVDLFYIFLGAFIPFSIVAVQIYIPTNSAQVFFFLHILASTYYFLSFGNNTLARWTFVGKVMSLLFNMLSRLVIAFLPRSKCLLTSWCSHHLQSI